VVIGYSMGGPIGQLLWRRRPDLVRGLVLCATSATYSHNLVYRTVWRGMGLYQLLLRLLPRHAWERGLEAQAEGRIPRIFSRLVHPGTPPHILEALHRSWRREAIRVLRRYRHLVAGQAQIRPVKHVPESRQAETSSRNDHGNNAPVRADRKTQRDAGTQFA
jgi:pimeloyl-ACP methyl ester carboxylesterase